MTTPTNTNALTTADPTNPTASPRVASSSTNSATASSTASTKPMNNPAMIPATLALQTTNSQTPPATVRSMNFAAGTGSNVFRMVCAVMVSTIVLINRTKRIVRQSNNVRNTTKRTNVSIRIGCVSRLEFV